MGTTIRWMPASRRTSVTGLRRPPLVTLVVAAALACDPATEPPPDPLVPTTVAVTPAATELTAFGNSVQLGAEVRDQHGQVMHGAAVAWASRAEPIATVETSGLVTAVGDGMAVISATAGKAVGLARVTVTRAATINVFPLTDTILVGDTLRMIAEALDSAGNPVPDVTFSWTTDPPRMATVDDSGLVRATGVGATTRVTIAAQAGSTTGTTQITVFSPERSVLFSFYEQTGGQYWVEDDGWLGDRPIGFWQGVDTNQSGNVTALRLVSNGLTGPFPRETIMALPHLQHLILYQNGLTGEIPAELGDLSELRVFDLHNNQLTGGIPEELVALRNLQVLSLGGNGLTGEIPAEIGDLAELRELSLSRNRLTGGIPETVGKLTELRRLILFGNELSGPIPRGMGNLKRLQHLSLDNNQLTGTIPATLGSLGENLETIRANHNALTGPIPPELGGLTNMGVLELNANALTGSIPPELGRLANLSRMELDENDLTGGIAPELGRLANLRLLRLSGNPRMSGALPDNLTSLSQLNTLMTGGTDLCSPQEPGFRTWLDGVRRQRVKACGADEVRVYLTQAVQSREFPVPLVAGDDALLRVFVTAATPTEESIPDVRARFYLGGTETHVAEIPGKSTPIPTEVDESSLAMSANSAIPGAVLQPGLEMVIEIDPDGQLDPSLGVKNRIPETGRMAVNVKAMPVFEVTVIPFLAAPSDSSILEVTGGMAADPHGHEMLYHTRTLLPVGDIDVEEHGPVRINSRFLLHLVVATRSIRYLEESERYHLGLMPLPVYGDHGYAYPNGRASAAVPHSVMIAKVFASNFWLGDAPCGDTYNPDPDYPYADGTIGAWGYDRHGDTLVAPSLPDLTSFCWPQWIGGYHFGKAVRYRLDDEYGASVASPGQSLILSGGVDGDGTPFLDPALVVDGPAVLPQAGGDYRLEGSGAEGEQLFSLRFGMLEVGGDDGARSFFFAIPVEPEWAGELAGITLSGPEGSLVLDADSDRSLAILRDFATGEVRSILRDLPGVRTHSDAVAALSPAPGLEVLFSRGIPDADAWRR